MKFDSTAYLVASLKEKLKFSEEYINYCIRILNGFVIKPGSIKYDENNETLTLNVTLPNSELRVSKITISNSGIYMKLYSKDITININCAIYMQKVQLSILIDSEKNNCSGIYYYDSSVLNVNGGDLERCGMYSYYDAGTLKVINESYLLDYVRLEMTLNDLVGYKPEKINTLGFIPDVTELVKKNSDEKHCSSEQFADNINMGLVAFNYDDIINMLSSKFSKQSETVIGPVRRK